MTHECEIYLKIMEKIGKYGKKNKKQHTLTLRQAQGAAFGGFLLSCSLSFGEGRGEVS